MIIKTITYPQKPYPPIVWMEKPIKTFLILLGIGAGALWLVNGRLENPPLPEIVTKSSAATCIGALGSYFLYATLSTHKEERFAKKCRNARKRVLAELEYQGFTPTRRFIGSARMLLVDEIKGNWCLFDYFNNPGQTRLHKLSAITAISVAENRAWVPQNHKILLPTGRRLTKKDNNEYYGKKGVLFSLDEKDCPYVFINCYKTENDVAIITKYFQAVLAHSEGFHESE